jgi:hypothetical protein
MNYPVLIILGSMILLVFIMAVDALIELFLGKK